MCLNAMFVAIFISFAGVLAFLSALYTHYHRFFRRRFAFVNEKCMKYKSFFFCCLFILYEQQIEWQEVGDFKLDQLSDRGTLYGGQYINVFANFSPSFCMLVMVKLRHIAQFLPFRRFSQRKKCASIFLPFSCSALAFRPFKNEAAAFIRPQTFLRTQKKRTAKRIVCRFSSRRFTQWHSFYDSISERNDLLWLIIEPVWKRAQAKNDFLLEHPFQFRRSRFKTAFHSIQPKVNGVFFSFATFARPDPMCGRKKCIFLLIFENKTCKQQEVDLFITGHRAALPKETTTIFLFSDVPSKLELSLATLRKCIYWVLCHLMILSRCNCIKAFSLLPNASTSRTSIKFICIAKPEGARMSSFSNV